MEHRGRARRDDDVEEIDFLLSCHQGVAAIVAAIGPGRKPESIARNMARYGRPDLARMFNTQSTHYLTDPDERAPAK